MPLSINGRTHSETPSRSSSKTSPAPFFYIPQTDISAQFPPGKEREKQRGREGGTRTQSPSRTSLSPHPSPFRSCRATAPGSLCRRRSASQRRRDLFVSSQQVHEGQGVGRRAEARGILELEGRERKGEERTFVEVILPSARSTSTSACGTSSLHGVPFLRVHVCFSVCCCFVLEMGVVKWMDVLYVKRRVGCVVYILGSGREGSWDEG